MLNVDIGGSGPVFDGRARAAAKDYVEAAVDDVAATGLRDVQTNLARVLRHPTGSYQSHIKDRASGTRHVIHDDRVVYGPWLEGVGSRNAPETVFAGYSTFRLTAQALEKKAGQIAERTLPRYLERMQ